MSTVTGTLRKCHFAHVGLETGVQLVEEEDASPDIPDFDTLVLPVIGEDEVEEEGECEVDQEMPAGENLPLVW